MTRRGFLRTALGAAVASGTMGCRWGGATGLLDGARLSARPGSPTREPITGFNLPLGLDSGRDGWLYVPNAYSPDDPMPLLVALHGAGGEGRNWSSYPARAEAHGMIFLAPDSRESTWDLIRGGFGPDVAFLDEALGAVFDQCAVDPARIALGGFSDGASYALSLGPANGDLFTHVVAYSPGFVSIPGRVGRPRVFVSHGTGDPVLSHARTANEIVPSFIEEGYDVTFVSFEGGHEVPADLSETALSWFLEDVAPAE